MGNIWLEGFLTEVDLYFYVRLDGTMQDKVTKLRKNSILVPIWTRDKIVDELNSQLTRWETFYFMKIKNLVHVMPLFPDVASVSVFCIDEYGKEAEVDFLYSSY